MSYRKAPWNKLSDLLEEYPSTADDIESIVHIIQAEYPMIPTPKIIYPGDGWNFGTPCYVHQMHLLNEEESFRISLENIMKTGRIPDSSEKIYLRHILNCPFMSWSATTPAHHEDDWVLYIRHEFTLPGLVPILDDMTWPEEIAVLPQGYGIGGPRFLLLADATNFYFYEYEGSQLWKAGVTLEEVYLGLKRKAWWFDSVDSWDEVEDNGEEYDHDNYFPMWNPVRKEDGTRRYKLVVPLKPFIPFPKSVIDVS